MSLDDVLARGRVAAEALMTDVCVIDVPTGPAPFDTATGVLGAVPTQRVYPAAGQSGRCRLQVRQVQPDVPTSGEHRYVIATLELSLPVSAPNVPSDAVVTIVASKFDAANVGRTFTVIAGMRKSQATAYRIQVEEVAG